MKTLTENLAYSSTFYRHLSMAFQQKKNEEKQEWKPH